ncbi:MAG: AAA family ATPase [Clostridiales bacterium]|nr:AAA family ATPase [Clostridiales bacterium]
MTAMRCCGDPERKPATPDFFKSFVKRDLSENTRETGELIDMLNGLLVASAMINGDFTVEEANCLSGILDGLISYARAEGLVLGITPDNSDKVTGKKFDTYLQNGALSEPSGKSPSSNADSAKDADDDKLSVKIININFDGVSSKTQSEEGLTEVPNEGSISNTAPDKTGSETMESLLDELDGLVGLENVKHDVHSLMNFIKVTKIREKRGMKVPTISYHLVFTGNPGTGKTTVARLVAKLYYHMGILPQGQLVETDRSALVAGYLGQTAIKTQKVISQAMGGVLFIDEAYSLAGDDQDSYGKEAIETILKAMEDHRDELVVIVAGYTDLMHKFIESNPGLSSRFSKYFEYPDYTGEELLLIFERFCKKNGYSLVPEASKLLKEKFDALYETRDKHFGNARAARNIFEKAINAQADRIASEDSISDEDLENITVDDISVAIGGVG